MTESAPEPFAVRTRTTIELTEAAVTQAVFEYLLRCSRSLVPQPTREGMTLIFIPLSGGEKQLEWKWLVEYTPDFSAPAQPVAGDPLEFTSWTPEREALVFEASKVIGAPRAPLLAAVNALPGRKIIMTGLERKLTRCRAKQKPFFVRTPYKELADFERRWAAMSMPREPIKTIPRNQFAGVGKMVDPDAATGCADDQLPGTAEDYRAAAGDLEVDPLDPHAEQHISDVIEPIAARAAPWDDRDKYAAFKAANGIPVGDRAPEERLEVTKVWDSGDGKTVHATVKVEDDETWRRITEPGGVSMSAVSPPPVATTKWRKPLPQKVIMTKKWHVRPRVSWTAERDKYLLSHRQNGGFFNQALVDKLNILPAEKPVVSIGAATTRWYTLIKLRDAESPAAASSPSAGRPAPPRTPAKPPVSAQTSHAPAPPAGRVVTAPVSPPAPVKAVLQPADVVQSEDFDERGEEFVTMTHKEALAWAKQEHLVGTNPHKFDLFKVNKRRKRLGLPMIQIGMK